MNRSGQNVPKVATPRGRPFANGNPGRKRGSKNRSTLVAEALLSDEKDELLRKAIELAKAGDVQMLKFLLERTLPRERLIKLDLPRRYFADAAVDALRHIMSAVAEGMISPSEAAALATLMNSYSDAIDIADVVERRRVANP
jgi:hypothetical protein